MDACWVVLRTFGHLLTLFGQKTQNEKQNNKIWTQNDKKGPNMHPFHSTPLQCIHIPFSSWGPPATAPMCCLCSPCVVLLIVIRIIIIIIITIIMSISNILVAPPSLSYPMDVIIIKVPGVGWKWMESMDRWNALQWSAMEWSRWNALQWSGMEWMHFGSFWHCWSLFDPNNAKSKCQGPFSAAYQTS